MQAGQGFAHQRHFVARRHADDRSAAAMPCSSRSQAITANVAALPDLITYKAQQMVSFSPSLLRKRESTSIKSL